jgi:hypothetical protein
MRLVLALVLVVACGGDDSGGGGGGGGGGDGGGGGGADGPKPTHAGFVAIQSYDAMNTPSTPTRGGTASAGFPASGDYCTTVQTIGACEVKTCTTPSETVSAGAITITGAAEAITLTPAADHTYATFMTAMPLFAGGESITFSAAGAEVPAFTASITTPAKATITSPAKPTPNAPYLNINRTLDMTVRWTGDGTGQVQVALNSSNAEHRLFCRFDASAGEGTLPTAALMTLDAGLGGFAMGSIADAEHDAGDWAIDVSAYFNAVWPDNAIVSGATMFQ